MPTDRGRIEEADTTISRGASNTERSISEDDQPGSETASGARSPRFGAPTEDGEPSCFAVLTRTLGRRTRRDRRIVDLAA